MTTKLAYTINEACQSVGIGRTTVYKLIKYGVLRPAKIGCRTLIPAEQLEQLLQIRDAA